MSEWHESFFLLQQSIKTQLIEALRAGHAAGSAGIPVEEAIKSYSATRAIFTETEQG
jgi:hypothetical protein